MIVAVVSPTSRAARRQAETGGAVIRHDEARGSKRLRRWREKANFKNDRFFVERLEGSGQYARLIAAQVEPHLIL